VRHFATGDDELVLNSFELLWRRKNTTFSEDLNSDVILVLLNILEERLHEIVSVRRGVSEPLDEERPWRRNLVNVD
jgi:hypothetical protein